MTYIIIYLIGFIAVLTFLKYFGKRIDLDYDNNEKNYGNMDDWDSNVNAYTAFSILWPLTGSIFLLGATWALLKILVKQYLKK